jgi:hypothetical protein
MVGSDQVSIHTTQTDSRLSPGSSTVSDENTQTMVLHHVSSSDEEMLHPPGFPRIPDFPPRHGAMINVVSQDEDPPAGARPINSDESENSAMLTELNVA